MSTRKVYYRDVVTAMAEQNITAQFEKWADIYCPDVPSYYDVLVDIAQDRGIEQLYEDVKSGKFAQELKT